MLHFQAKSAELKTTCRPHENLCGHPQLSRAWIGKPSRKRSAVYRSKAGPKHCDCLRTTATTDSEWGYESGKSPTKRQAVTQLNRFTGIGCETIGTHLFPHVWSVRKSATADHDFAIGSRFSHQLDCLTDFY